MADLATGEILANVIDGAVEESHAKVPKAVPVKDDENDRQEAAFRWAPEDREHAQAEKIDRLEREAAAAPSSTRFAFCTLAALAACEATILRARSPSSSSSCGWHAGSW